jgi:hypothetical protein
MLSQLNVPKFTKLFIFYAIGCHNLKITFTTDTERVLNLAS